MMASSLFYSDADESQRSLFSNKVSIKSAMNQDFVKPIIDFDLSDNKENERSESIFSENILDSYSGRSQGAPSSAAVAEKKKAERTRKQAAQRRVFLEKFYHDRYYTRESRNKIARYLAKYPNHEQEIVIMILLSRLRGNFPQKHQCQDAGISYTRTILKWQTAFSERGMSPIRNHRKIVMQKHNRQLLSPFAPKGPGFRSPLPTVSRDEIQKKFEQSMQAIAEQERRCAIEFARSVREQREMLERQGKTRAEYKKFIQETTRKGLDKLFMSYVHWLNQQAKTIEGITPNKMIQEFHISIAPFCEKVEVDGLTFFYNLHDIQMDICDAEGRNNLQRMLQARNPIDLDHDVMEWHHLTQEDKCPIVLIRNTIHNLPGLHRFNEAMIDRSAFNRARLAANQLIASTGLSS